MENYTTQSQENSVNEKEILISTEKNYSIEKESERWNKIKDFIKLTTSVLVLHGAIGTSEGSEDLKEVEALKNTVEQSKFISFKEEQKLIELVSNIGRNESLESSSEVNGVSSHESIPVKVLTSNNTTFVIGYTNESRVKPKWIMVESPDKTISFLDKDVNGSVDRYVINKSSETQDQKAARGMIGLFSDAESIDDTLALEIKIKNALNKNTSVINIGVFNYKNNDISLHTLSSDGEPVTIGKSTDLYKYNLHLQNDFTNLIKGGVANYH